jgi:phosphoribosylformimino-5-aminoimidazole carboxamide ribotide isomerase
VAAVILFPAIDLKEGKCVRLERGDMQKATIFNLDPAAQALAFERQGFQWLHVVDLNGAFAGIPVNGEAVDAILSRVSIPIQLGGGIRTLAHIEAWLEKGVARVILGTAALRDPKLVFQACLKFPGRIAVGIDARSGRVAVEGWAATTDVTAMELARRLEGAGVSAIIYTDVDRDGVLKGLNFESTLALAVTTSIPVVASGGLASMADIARLTAPESRRLEGAIVGRALYDGRIDAGEALRLASEATPC